MSETRMRDPAVQPIDRASEEPPPRPSAFRFEGERSDESIAGLIERLAEQGSHLAEQQLKLVEAEVRSGVADIKESVGAMAGAAVLGLAGVGVLLMGFAFLLGGVMPLWLATMLVAAAALAGAGATYSTARSKLRSSSLSAERTKQTLERAPSAISGHQEEARRHEQ